MDDRLEICVLGGLSIRRNGAPITGFRLQKAAALFVYLACTGRAQAREVLAELFWGERSQAQAASNLRTVLTELRQQLARFIIVDRQTIALNTSSVYCLGCCWGLMLVLFVVGMMNLVGMVILSAIIFVEKVVPYGQIIGKLTALALIGIGLLTLLLPILSRFVL